MVLVCAGVFVDAVGAVKWGVGRAVSWMMGKTRGYASTARDDEEVL